MLKRIPTMCSLAAIASLGFTPAVYADQYQDTGFYAGGALGFVKFDSGRFDDDNSFPQIFAGYQFTPYFGVEGAWQDWGEFENNAFNSEIDSYSLSLTGRLPLSTRFALIANFGALWYETDIRAQGAFDKIDNEELTFGVGGSYEISDNLDFRLAYDRVDLDLDFTNLGDAVTGDFDSDIESITLGLKYEFGGSR